MMINTQEIYNSSLANHTKTINLSNLFALKQILRMQSESMIVSDFNLHYSLWRKSLYSRQHALSKTLLELIRMTDATLMLFENTIIKNCHKERTTIDLSFTKNALINKLIKWEQINWWRISLIICLLKYAWNFVLLRNRRDALVAIESLWILRSLNSILRHIYRNYYRKQRASDNV